MALLAARRAAVLLRPRAAPLLRPAAARFSSSPDDYRALVAYLRDISRSAQADKNYFTGSSGGSVRDKAGAQSPRDKVDAIRAATHDGEVLRAIDDAMRSQHHGLVKEISTDFPFELKEKEGLTDIALTRSLKGEQIVVLVSTPKLGQDVECAEDDSNVLSSSNENHEDKGKTSLEEYSLPVRVTVSKADGSGLEFTCTANADKIAIESLSLLRRTPGAEEDYNAVTYDEGTADFCELDKNLQETFHKYLEVRGITARTTKVLHEYMINKDRSVFQSKDKRKNLVFLTKLSHFVKKD